MINESTNVVDNICLWDGNLDTWQPPIDYLMLVQATTPALTWILNADKTDWELGQVMGAGAIGFTWNGAEVLTDQLKPAKPQPQPTTDGLQTA